MLVWFAGTRGQDCPRSVVESALAQPCPSCPREFLLPDDAEFNLMFSFLLVAIGAYCWLLLPIGGWGFFSNTCRAAPVRRDQSAKWPHFF